MGRKQAACSAKAFQRFVGKLASPGRPQQRA